MALFGYQTTLAAPAKPKPIQSPYAVSAGVRAAQAAAKPPTTQSQGPNLTPAGDFTGQRTVPNTALATPAPKPAPAPAPPPAAPAAPVASSPPPAAGPGPTPASWDPNLDPVYQQIQNDAAKTLANQGNDVTAQERQLAITLGDPTWAATVLGANDPALAGVSDSPTSLTTLGQLARQLQADQLSTDEGLGQQNLFFSGARVGKQRDLAYKHTTDVQAAEGKAQDQYHTLEQQRMADEDAYNKAVEDALAAAYGRRLAEPIQQPNPPSDSSSSSASTATVPDVDTAIATAIKNAQAGAGQTVASKKPAKLSLVPYLSGLRAGGAL